jgi:hypothetical protein
VSGSVGFSVEGDVTGKIDPSEDFIGVEGTGVETEFNGGLVGGVRVDDVFEIDP